MAIASTTITPGTMALTVGGAWTHSSGMAIHLSRCGKCTNTRGVAPGSSRTSDPAGRRRSSWRASSTDLSDADSALPAGGPAASVTRSGSVACRRPSATAWNACSWKAI